MKTESKEAVCGRNSEAGVAVKLPSVGDFIAVNEKGHLVVPDCPYIAFVRGDGVGVDITPVMREVVDAAVNRAYGGRRQISWVELYAGERSVEVYGEGIWLPEETLSFLRRFHVAIKGPLTTPVGGGIRSLNVALRQGLDLYICLRPVRYFAGVPSPLKHPEYCDMVIFRENAEDIYAGIEWEASSPEARRVLNFLSGQMGVRQIREPECCGVGVKVMSRSGARRLIRAAIAYALRHHRRCVTLVHKGNIMKYTEGAFRQWGYELAREEFGARPAAGGSALVIRDEAAGRDIIVNDCIADAFLQNILLRPRDYDVVATLNLNGDYISDALAAQVGGIGIAPGANLGDECAIFEATHGTAPSLAGTGQANPGSLLLSAEMMLRHIGWDEAADLVMKGVSGALAGGSMTADLATARSDKVRPLSTAEFGQAVIAAFD